MRPYDVKSEADQLAMATDNHPQDVHVWSMLNHDDKVSLHPPANSDWIGFVEIPRDQFNAMIDWYTLDQAPTPAANAVTAGQGVEAGLQAELAAIRKSVRNAMGAIESNQVADKDVHGTLNGVLKRLDALVGAKELTQ